MGIVENHRTLATSTRTAGRSLRAALLGITLLTGFVTAGCEPTPAYLERWANTDGSEGKFAGYLKSTDVSHEVRVTAMRLLLDQWQYSSAMFLNGQVLREMPDAAERDRVILATIPHLQARFAAEGTRNATLDALFQIRAGTDSAEVKAALDGMLLGWINEHWSACLQRSGQVPVSQFFNAVGAEAGSPALIRTVAEGSPADLECVRRTLEQISWAYRQSALADALIARWRGGPLAENPQLTFNFFEHITRYQELPQVREWLFGLLSDPNTDPLYTNAALDVLSRNPTDGDAPRFDALLSAPRNIKWAAFKTIVERDGSAGLGRALGALPAQADYTYYDGGTPADGFRSAARNVVCAIPKLTELGDNARQQFELHLRSPNLYTRALAWTCLERFGDAQTINNLTTVLTELGPEPIPVPGFGPTATFQSLAPEVITAIQTRLQPPTP